MTHTKPPAVLSNPADFYTRSNESVKFPLKAPDGGTSDHYLTVLGSESTTWRKARQKKVREQFELSLSGEKPLDTDDDDMKTAEWLSKLVVDWSFPQPITEEVVRDFLYNAPSEMDRLDSFISKRSNFLKKK